MRETPTNNPARIAFEAYFAGQAENKRHCADPATVLYAVTGTQYFGEAGPSACDVREDGFTRWNAGRDKQHFYNTQKLPIKELGRGDGAVAREAAEARRESGTLNDPPGRRLQSVHESVIARRVALG